jgi:hypothetical protein
VSSPGRRHLLVRRRGEMRSRCTPPAVAAPASTSPHP